MGRKRGEGKGEAGGCVMAIGGGGDERPSATPHQLMTTVNCRAAIINEWTGDQQTLTVFTCSMSRPRAARSVAIRTAISLSLNLLRASRR